MSCTCDDVDVPWHVAGCLAGPRRAAVLPRHLPRVSPSARRDGTVKRWQGIRHVRYWYLRRKVWQWAAECAQLGLGLGYPNSADLEHLEGIRRGRW